MLDTMGKKFFSDSKELTQIDNLNVHEAKCTFLF